MLAEFEPDSSFYRFIHFESLSLFTEERRFANMSIYTNMHLINYVDDADDVDEQVSDDEETDMSELESTRLRLPASLDTPDEEIDPDMPSLGSYEDFISRTRLPAIFDNPDEEIDPDMPSLISDEEFRLRFALPAGLSLSSVLMQSIINIATTSGREALCSDNTKCSICHDNCFDESKPSKIMCFPCGNIHDPMHVECFKKCASWSSRCPLCRKEVLFE